ncbi:MAG: hypothetical protein R3D44_09985 [Hyphomicrobiaceae bacterium]
MELDEDFRWLRASNNEAELDRYCAHPAVRAFHVANREFGPLLLRALSTCPRTIADCEIQEWCESLAREDDPDDPLLQYWEPIMRWQREFVRRRAETQSSHA